jgi:hypothetical protein
MELSPKWRALIDGRRASLGMSQSVLAGLAGVTENRLSAFVVGAKALENRELTRLYDILRDCERLAELAFALRGLGPGVRRRVGHENVGHRSACRGSCLFSKSLEFSHDC